MSAKHQLPTRKHEHRLLQLQARCQIQREYLARDVRAFQPMFEGVDQLTEIVKVTKQFSTPIKYGILAGFAGLMLSRPKQALSLATTAIRYWSWWQNLSSLFAAATHEHANERAHENTHEGSDSQVRESAP